MNERASTVRRLPARAVLVLAVVAWFAANLWWLDRYRRGQPLNIDEAGYLSMALNDYRGWERAGWGEWVAAVFWPGVQSPLTPAATSVAFVVAGPRLGLGFVVVLLAGAASLLVTAALANRLGRPHVVWLSVLLAGGSPSLLMMSRQFIFAIPVTLVVIATLYALVRSDGLARLPWALAMGLGLGLLPLTRTMALAFVPGILLAALVPALAGEGRARRLLHGLVAVALAVAVAAPWLYRSRDLVFGYLTSFGYGAQSSAYTNDAATRLGSALLVVVKELFVPLSVVFAVGWVLAAGYAIASLRGTDRRQGIRRVAMSPLTACVTFVLVGVAALATSRNAGSGFATPLIPPAAVVTAWGISTFAGTRVVAWQRVTALSVAAAVPATTLVAFFVPGSPFAVPRYVILPSLGTVIVTEGRDLDPAYNLTARRGADNNPTYGDEWAEVNEELGARLLDGTTERPDLAAGFRGFYVNVNTLQVEVLQDQAVGVPMAQIDPLTLAGAEAYRGWLTVGDAANACHLLTSPGQVNEFKPFVDTDALVQVAAESGFAPVEEFETPDGRTITLWERESAGC